LPLLNKGKRVFPPQFFLGGFGKKSKEGKNPPKNPPRDHQRNNNCREIDVGFWKPHKNPKNLIPKKKKRNKPGFVPQGVFSPENKGCFLPQHTPSVFKKTKNLGPLREKTETLVFGEGKKPNSPNRISGKKKKKLWFKRGPKPTHQRPLHLTRGQKRNWGGGSPNLWV